jgi:hypothetical protein
MVVAPTARAVAIPIGPMVATEVFDDVHCACPVMFCCVPFEKIAMATNWRFSPTWFVGLIGWTTIWLSVGPVTVTVVDPATPPTVAVTVVVPTPVAVSCPRAPLALLTVATPVLAVVHTAVAVRSTVVMSEYTPVAFIDWRMPTSIVEFAGVTDIETSAAAVTVRVVEPVTPARLATARVVPSALPVASPCEPGALLIDAMPESSVDQVTLVVMSIDEPSEYVPRALSARFVASGMDGFVGPTSMRTSVAAVTVTLAAPLTAPSVAVIAAPPAPTAVTTPFEPVAFETTATFVALDDQVTLAVTSAVVMSE